MSGTGRRQVSGERRFAYYGGMLLIAFGLVVFVTGMVKAVGGGGTFVSASDGPSSLLTFGLIGMALFAAGGMLRNLGARGLAGSGAVLDPERARRDLEPFSRQAGGMLKDALDEAGLRPGGGPEKVIMVKCPACSTLNEADSKFCQECGRSL